MDLTNLNKNRQKSRNSIDLQTMVYGKVPPQAKSLEEAVLGAIMLDKSSFDVVSELLKPESFYVEAHQRIFKAMVNLSIKCQPIDILTVVEELKNSEELELVGGPYYVTKLTNAVTSGTNNETYSRIILQKFKAREMIRICGETIGAAYDDTDVFDMIESHEKQLTEITSDGKGKSFVPMDEILIENIQRIEELRIKKQHITGIPSGLRELDRITHGWQNSDLIILAARPGVGKTAFALQLCSFAACENQTPVLFFSMEMSKLQLGNRALSAQSEIWMDSLSNGNLDNEQMKTLYTKGVQKLVEAKIFIDDTPALTIFELRARARRWKRLCLKLFGEKSGLIIVDYLQLMNGTSDKRGNREQEISQISRGLKQIAKEFNDPVIALSQLSRNVENRSGEKKMPQLSDLRESGAIEQDADMVMFLYRPEYYDKESDDQGESTKGLTEIKIAKHRNGKLDTIKMRADLNIQKFYDWEEQTVHIPKGGNWTPVKTTLPYADDGEPF